MQRTKGLLIAAGAMLAAGFGGLLGTHLRAGVFYPDGATTLHFAFEGSPNGDRPVVRPPAYYKADDGFGFVDSPGLIGTSRGVTAPKYFRFDANIPAGTYEVTVVCGGASGDSTTQVKAEGKAIDGEINAARNQTGTKTFTVTVRRGNATNGEKTDSIETDARINLEFSGTNPSLMKLDIKPAGAAATP